MGSLEHAAASEHGHTDQCDSADLVIESLAVLFASPADVSPPAAAEVPESKLSRKERKRLAARKHAEDYGTMTDTIVRLGAAAVVESVLVAPPILSRPFAGLPLDIVEHVLLPYLTLDSIRALMLMSPGIKHLMESRDDVWHMLFNTWDMQRHYKDRYLRARHRQTYQNGTWRFRVETLLGARPHSEDVAAARRAAEKARLATSKGSERVRTLLRERTANWPNEQVACWVLASEESNPCPTFHLEMPFEWTTVRYWWSPREFPQKQYLASARRQAPKSEVYRNQFICAHRNVVFVKSQHWYKCTDCNLVTHAPTVYADVYVE